MISVSEFDYYLPKKLIAQKPIRPRDHSRLFILNRKTGGKQHKHFYDIGGYLKEGDVLVLNNSKVFPARLIGKRKVTGGKIEVFLLKKISGQLWECLIGGLRRKKGLEVEFLQGLGCKAMKDNNDGTWIVKFNKGGDEFMKVIEKIGQTPLPPYIKRPSFAKASDGKDYQAVYADNKKVGSVAAPTAGFHFTTRLMGKLKKKGVQIEYITLHVGLGTFAPVKVNDIRKHKMHPEYVEVKKSVLGRIVKAKEERRRVIAVGTTSVRTLEAVFSQFPNPKSQITNKFEIRNSKFENFKDWVDIFIYPGYKFKIVDGMITNFHLPKSTLLMLISAFAGRKNILKAYQKATEKKYRFYSYGDSMFIF